MDGEREACVKLSVRDPGENVVARRGDVTVNQTPWCLGLKGCDTWRHRLRDCLTVPNDGALSGCARPLGPCIAARPRRLPEEVSHCATEVMGTPAHRVEWLRHVSDAFFYE
jgi:hypothetical protein